MDLKDKIVMITGAANGIGAQLTRDFLQKGACVYACDIDSAKLEAAFATMENCRIIHLDVREPAQWENAMEIPGGHLDYMVNAAGVIRPGYLREAGISDIELQLDVNLKGTIYGTKYAADVMRRNRKGHIINIASMAGLAPVSGIGIYTASKFGVRGFSLAMAQELSDDGIKVSVVAPDAVDTGMLDDQVDSEAAALTFSGSRILTTEDVSRAIFRDVIKGGRTEIWIPLNRGIQAYLGATFPGLAVILTKALRRKGLKQQAEFRKARKE